MQQLNEMMVDEVDVTFHPLIKNEEEVSENYY